MLPLYAVFGSPIGHSLSPRIHNAAFGAEGIHAHYFPIEVQPSTLIHSLKAFRQLGGVGVNLTRPLKESIVPFLDDMTELAAAAQAANTIVWRDGAWHGDNTDVRAFVAKVGPTIANRPRPRALVIGAGGVARGSVVGLRHLDVEVWVTSRRRAAFGDHWLPWLEMESSEMDWDIVINATPLGQHGEASWAIAPRLSKGKTVVVDWVYHPRDTWLLKLAVREGCLFVDGLDLLIEQARWSWQLWFGRLAPAEPMWKALE